MVFRYQPTTIDKVESDVGFTIRKKMHIDDLYMDRDSQVKAIEKTFEDALKAGLECTKRLPTKKLTKGCRSCMGEHFEHIRQRGFET